MPLNFNDTTFNTRYRDDFTDSDGYYRILFNSGKALQARELTQMQTIIQNQIERFGNGLLKEGAVVKAGGLTVDNAYEFVKLDPTSTSTTATVGSILTGATSGVTGVVLAVEAASGSDPATIFVRYNNTTNIALASTSPRFTPGESLGSGLIVQIIDTTANPAVGRGTLVTAGESIFFSQGLFVWTEEQTLILDKYSDIANGEVGFQILQDIITVNDTNKLYDNQGTNPNLTAPGADRYRVRLKIIEKSDVPAGGNFLHIATVKNGVVFNVVEDAYVTQFSIPRDLLALRIKENSGDYIVKPFKLLFEDDSANTHLLMNVSDGIGVIEGYRVARNTPTKIRVAKPTTTYEITNEATGIDFGNYVEVHRDSSVSGPNTNTMQQLNLRDSADYNGSTIGTARVRAITDVGGNSLRYSLFDIQMNSGNNFREVKSIGTGSGQYFNPLRLSNNTVLSDRTNHSLIFPLQGTRPSTISNASLTHQYYISGTSSAGGQLTIDVSTIGTLDNANDWIFLTPTGTVDNSTLGGLNVGSGTTTVTGLPTSTAIKAYVYVQEPSAIVRTKTNQTDTRIYKTIETVNGQQQINLDVPDVHNIKAIKLTDSNGIDIADRFALDDGRRDNMYNFSRLLLRPGATAPTGNVYVRFDYFSHGPGNFFAANSYNGAVNYADIPDYRNAAGERIDMRDVLDFRPVSNDSDGNFATSGISYLPQPATVVTSDNTYYNAQAGILSIDKENNFIVTLGDPAQVATVDQSSIIGLPLYRFTLNANTLNDSDLSISIIDHRRYTMKDIGMIEDRIDKLEEAVALNALENSILSYQVYDSAGLDRTRAGIFVDNFYDHTRIDRLPGAGYRASIDPLKGHMRPGFIENNIRLIYDSAASTNTILKGDNVYVKHDEIKFLEQPFACLATKINPFTTSTYEGNVVVSPASDEWRDIEVASKTMIDGGTKLATNNALNWDNWSWNWGGKTVDELKVGDNTNTITKTSGSTKTKTVNKVVSESTLLEVIGQRVLNIALLPYIRSRIVSIKARGLRPNTNVAVFFDGDRLEDYVREAPFERYSSTTKDYGNTLKGLLSHPDGATALITNANGEVDISFMIPNNSSYKYRAGSHEIKILDITIDREELAGTIARGVYTAQGYLDTVHQDIKSTRVLEVEGSKTTEIIHYYSSGGDGRGGRTSSGGGDNDYTPSHYSDTGGYSNSGSRGRQDYDGGGDPWGGGGSDFGGGQWT